MTIENISKFLLTKPSDELELRGTEWTNGIVGVSVKEVEENKALRLLLERRVKHIAKVMNLLAIEEQTILDTLTEAK